MSSLGTLSPSGGRAPSASAAVLKPGSKVWVRNPYSGNEEYRAQWLPKSMCARPIWVPAEVLGLVGGAASVAAGGVSALSVRTLLNPPIPLTVMTNEVLPLNPVTGLDDCADFPFPHAPALSYSLTRRYLEENTWTRAGALWISINPCRTLTDVAGVALNDPLYQARYRARVPKRQVEALPFTKRAALSLPPHCYDACDTAYAGMQQDGVSQALCFLGEAGSGKSESAKQALQFLLTAPLLEASPLNGGYGVKQGQLALLLSLNDQQRLQQHLTAAGLLSNGTNGSSSEAALHPDGAAAKGGPRASTALLADLHGHSTASSLPSLLVSPDLNGARREAQSRLALGGGLGNSPLGTAANPFLGQNLWGQPAPTTAAAARGPILSALSASLGSKMNRASRMLLASHVLLDSFGCCSTEGEVNGGFTGHGNSSRFTRLSKVYYSRGAPSEVICGSVQVGLLERSRILHGAAWRDSSSDGSSSSAGSNYHVLARLCYGASRALRSEVGLEAPHDYSLLRGHLVLSSASSSSASAAADVLASGLVGGIGATTTASSTLLHPSSLADDFNTLLAAMTELGLPQQIQGQVWRVLSALLALGNVRVSTGLAGSGDNITSPGQGSAVILNEREALKAARLLGMEDPQSFVTALTRKPRGVVQSDHSAIGSSSSGGAVTWTFKRASDVRESLDSLCQSIYSSLVAWLVSFCNAAMRQACGSDKWESNVVTTGGEPLFVAVLDGLGLEKTISSSALPSSSASAASYGSSPIPTPPSPADALAAVVGEKTSSLSTASGRLGAPSSALVSTGSSSLPVGDLHTLLRNYCYEKQQEVYSACMFKSEALLYESEGISSSAIQQLIAGSDDNSALVELLDSRRTGILSCLEDAGEQQLLLYSNNKADGSAASNNSAGASSTGASHSGSPALDAALATKLSSLHRKNHLLATSVGSGVSASAVSTAAETNPAALLFAVRHSGGTVCYSASKITTINNKSLASSSASSSSLGFVCTDKGLAEVISRTAMPLLKKLLLTAGGNSEATLLEADLYSRWSRLLANEAAAGGAASAASMSSALVMTNESESKAFFDKMDSTTAASVKTGSNDAFAVGSGGGVSTVSATSQAFSDIVSLLRPLATLQPHFIRCLRPNNSSLRPRYVDPSLLTSQLVSGGSGVMQSIAMRHLGYPCRTSYQDFYERFILLASSSANKSTASLYGEAIPSEPLVFPPPPGANMRLLCQSLLSQVLASGSITPPASALNDGAASSGSAITLSSLSGSVQFGSSRIFMKKWLLDALESLREARVKYMDACATAIQACWRGKHVRLLMARVRNGAGALTAVWRSLHARALWVHTRAACVSIQAWARYRLAYARFKRLRESTLQIQAWWRMILASKKWHILRLGLRTTAALARGYTIRCHVMRLIAAAVKIQALARRFLVRLTIYKVKDRAAGMFAAAWRGYRFRLDNEDVLQYLSWRRAERVRIRAATRIAALWRAQVTRRKFNRLCQGARLVQQWMATKLQRSKFLTQKTAALKIQSCARGFLSRLRVRRLKTLQLIGDELWRLSLVRLRESVEITRQRMEETKVAVTPHLFAQAQQQQQSLGGGSQAPQQHPLLMSSAAALPASSPSSLSFSQQQQQQMRSPAGTLPGSGSSIANGYSTPSKAGAKEGDPFAHRLTPFSHTSAGSSSAVLPTGAASSPSILLLSGQKGVGSGRGGDNTWTTNGSVINSGSTHPLHTSSPIGNNAAEGPAVRGHHSHHHNLPLQLSSLLDVDTLLDTSLIYSSTTSSTATPNGQQQQQQQGASSVPVLTGGWACTLASLDGEIKAAGSKGLSQLVVGGAHSLALSEGGHCYSWGYGDKGQLGLSGGSTSSAVTSGSTAASTIKPKLISSLLTDTHLASSLFDLVTANAAAAANAASSGAAASAGGLSSQQLLPAYLHSPSNPSVVNWQSLGQLFTSAAALHSHAAQVYSRLQGGSSSSSAIAAAGSSSSSSSASSTAGGSKVGPQTPSSLRSPSASVLRGQQQQQELPSSFPGFSASLSLAVPIRIRSIAAGEDHSLSLSDAGIVFAWGSGRRGQTGLGPLPHHHHHQGQHTNGGNAAIPSTSLQRFSGPSFSTNVPMPVFFPPLSLSAITTATKDGQDKHSGSSSSSSSSQHPHLSAGALAASSAAASASDYRVTEIACGSYFSLALIQGGIVFAWGDGAYTGQGSAVSSQQANKHHHGGHHEFAAEPLLPSPLPSPVPLATTAEGGASACPDSPSPVPVIALLMAPAPAASSANAAAATTASTAVVPSASSTTTTGGAITATAIATAAGANSAMGLNVVASSTTNNHSSTSIVTAATTTRIRHIAAGPDSCAAVTTDGRLYTWGSGRDGQLGLGEDVFRRRVRRYGSEAARQARNEARRLARLLAGTSLANKALAEEEEEEEEEESSNSSGSGESGDDDEQQHHEQNHQEKEDEQQLARIERYRSFDDQQQQQGGPSSSFHARRARRASTTPFELVTGKFGHRYSPQLVASLAGVAPSSSSDGTTSAATPSEAHRIASVSIGGHHMVCVSSTGKVFTWGSNSHGQLGLGVVGDIDEATLLQHNASVIPRLPLYYDHTPQHNASLKAKEERRNRRKDRAAAAAGNATASAVVDNTRRNGGWAIGSTTSTTPRGGASNHKGGSKGSSNKVYMPRPYCATPLQVLQGSLGSRHVSSVHAGRRATFAVTDSGEIFSWGCTAAARRIPACQRMLAQAIATAAGISTGGAAAASASSTNADGSVSSPSAAGTASATATAASPAGLSSASKAAAASASKSGALAAATSTALTVSTASAAAGTPSASTNNSLSEDITSSGMVLLSKPTLVSFLSDVPHRNLRRLIVSHSSSLSVVLASYSQAPLSTSHLRELAFSRAFRAEGLPLLLPSAAAAATTAGGTSGSAAPVSNFNDAPTLLMHLLATLQQRQAEHAHQQALQAAARAKEQQEEERKRRKRLLAIANGKQGQQDDEDDNDEQNDSDDDDQRRASSSGGPRRRMNPSEAARASFVSIGGISTYSMVDDEDGEGSLGGGSSRRSSLDDLDQPSNSALRKSNVSGRGVRFTGTDGQDGGNGEHDSSSMRHSTASTKLSHQPVRNRVLQATMDLLSNGGSPSGNTKGDALSHSRRTTGANSSIHSQHHQALLAAGGSEHGASNSKAVVRKPRKSAVDDTFFQASVFSAQRLAKAAAKEKQASLAALEVEKATALMHSIVGSSHVSSALLCLPPSRLRQMGLEELQCLYQRITSLLLHNGSHPQTPVNGESGFLEEQQHPLGSGGLQQTVSQLSAIRLLPRSHPLVVNEAITRTLLQSVHKEEMPARVKTELSMAAKEKVLGGGSGASPAAERTAAAAKKKMSADVAAKKAAAASSNGGNSATSKRKVDMVSLLAAQPVLKGEQQQEQVTATPSKKAAGSAAAPFSSNGRMFADATLGTLNGGPASAAVAVPREVTVVLTRGSSPSRSRAASAGSGLVPHTFVAGAVSIAASSPSKSRSQSASFPAGDEQEHQEQDGNSMITMPLSQYVQTLVREAAMEAALDWTNEGSAASGKANEDGDSASAPQPVPASPPRSVSVRGLLASVAHPRSPAAAKKEEPATSSSNSSEEKAAAAAEEQQQSAAKRPAFTVRPSVVSMAAGVSAPLPPKVPAAASVGSSNASQDGPVGATSAAIKAISSKALDIALHDAGTLQKGGDLSLQERLQALNAQLEEVRQRNAALFKEALGGGGGSSNGGETDNNTNE